MLGITPQTLYADTLPEESQWLETSEGKILSLYRATENRVTKGALLLLHTSEDPLLWPPALENLRRHLPRYGWETLAVSLPQPLANKPPARELPPPVKTPTADIDSENTTEPNSANELSANESSANELSGNEQSVSAPQTTEPAPEAETAEVQNLPREQLIQAYLLAAIKFLNDQGQFNLIILVDNSALYWSMQLLSPSITVNKQDNKRLEGPLQALIIANLQHQEPLSSAQLASSFSQPQLPILDIFFAPDNSTQQQARDKHRALAMRNKLQHYHPLLLGQQPKTAESDSNSFLLGRVRGFMESKAKGIEVKDAKVIREP